MKWEVMKLGEAIHVKHGFAFKGENFTSEGDFILLTPGNCHETGGLKLKGEREKFYCGEFPDEYLLSEGDLVVVMTDLVNTASVLGGAFVVPESGRYLHNQRLGLVTVTDETKLSKEFLYYLLNTHSYRMQIRGSARALPCATHRRDELETAMFLFQTSQSNKASPPSSPPTTT